MCLFLCLAGLGILAYLAQRDAQGDSRLFFILPAETGSPRFDVEKIEEFSEKEFLLTYQILGSERVSLSHAEYSVTLVATNSSYAQIMGLPMLEGSFFSKQAWTGKLRHAVLNEKAAFTIFGSNKIAGNRFRIRNDTWIVTGVISDGNEDRSRVYIPSSTRNGEADALALTNSGGLDEAYIKNSVKTLGIRDGDFHYIDMGTQYCLLWNRVEVIPLLFFGFLLLSLLRPLVLRFREAWFNLKKDLNRHYAVEILKKKSKSVLRLTFFALTLLLFPGLTLFLFLRLASVCLPWQDIPSLASLNLDLFYPHLVRIRNFELISRGFFGISLIFLALFFLGFNIRFLEKKM